MKAPLSVASAVAAALVAPLPASAATITLDRSCYVSGQAGTVSLAGFTPTASVTVANRELGSTQVITDATGAATVPVAPPAGEELGAPGSRAIEFTATEDAQPTVVARASTRIAPLAFQTAAGTMSPNARRRWSFSGWTPGKPIYAHFRYGGKTRGTYRFGLAAGVCGEYRRLAPGIVSDGTVRAGTWVIYVDQKQAFSPRTRPSLKDQTVVFTTFRPRTAPGPVALSTTAPGELPRFY